MVTETREVWHDGALVSTSQVEVPPEQANETTLRERALAALDTNRAYIARTSPTAAQTAAQVKALSQQNNSLIRLLLGRLDGTD